MYACPECGSNEALGVDALVQGSVDGNGSLQIDSSTAQFDDVALMWCGVCGHRGQAAAFQQEDWPEIKRRLGFEQEEEI